MSFSAFMGSVILRLRTVLLLFCCTVCPALLFSYLAIFIAATLRNKLTGQPLPQVCISARARMPEYQSGKTVRCFG